VCALAFPSVIVPKILTHEMNAVPLLCLQHIGHLGVVHADIKPDNILVNDGFSQVGQCIHLPSTLKLPHLALM
jgi:serine/threonine protein kinase